MTSWALWGTIVNTGAVLAGALFGLLIKLIAARARRKKAEIAEAPMGENRVADLIQKGLGLCVLIIGIMGALKVQDMLVMIVSIVLGALVGGLIDLDKWVNKLGALLEKSMKGHGGNVAEGFVAATLLFCVGAMTVTGAMESGMLHTHETYYAKAMIDMVSAVIFAVSLGVGVIFSSVGVFVVQGTMVAVAFFAGSVIPTDVVAEMMAVGSLLVIAIGTNLLGVTKIKVMNLVPAMFLPLALSPLFALIF